MGSADLAGEWRKFGLDSGKVRWLGGTVLVVYINMGCVRMKSLVFGSACGLRRIHGAEMWVSSRSNCMRVCLRVEVGIVVLESAQTVAGLRMEIGVGFGNRGLGRNKAGESLGERGWWIMVAIS